MQERRRCWEPRWDFTAKDDPTTFPIYITRGGALYGFCPGKAARDAEANHLFRLLMIAADTGGMLRQGGLEDQPDWFLEHLAWFLPRLDMARFAAKASMVLGGNSGKSEHEQFVQRILAERRRGGHNR